MLSPPDAELARRDRQLPGLALLLDTDALSAALRAALPGIDIGPAEVTYVKYKPEVNCLVGYSLQAAGGWVDVYGTAHRPDEQGKLRKIRKEQRTPGPFGKGAFVLGDHCVAIAVFPNDRKITILPWLANEAVRGPLLTGFVPRRTELWQATLRRLVYKPERRYVGELRAGDDSRAVLRAYRTLGYGPAHAGATACQSRDILRLAKVLGCSDQHQFMVLEWMPGRLLAEIIAASEAGSDAVALVGAALAELHAQDPKGLSHRTADAEATALLTAARIIDFLCPQLAGCAQGLAESIAVRLAAEQPAPRPIHGDFYDKQALLAGDRVNLLDLDEACWGDPAADLGNFMAHVERDSLRGQFPAGHVQRLGGALLEGYRRVSQPPDRSRIALYAALGLFRLAPMPFRHREPDWPERTEAILRRAQAILTSVVAGGDGLGGPKGASTA